MKALFFTCLDYKKRLPKLVRQSHSFYLYRPSLHGRDKFLLGFYKGVHPGDFISPDGVVGGLEDKRDIIGARVVHD